VQEFFSENFLWARILGDFFVPFLKSNIYQRSFIYKSACISQLVTLYVYINILGHHPPSWLLSAWRHASSLTSPPLLRTPMRDSDLESDPACYTYYFAIPTTLMRRSHVNEKINLLNNQFRKGDAHVDNKLNNKTINVNRKPLSDNMKDSRIFAKISFYEINRSR